MRVAARPVVPSPVVIQTERFSTVRSAPRTYATLERQARIASCPETLFGGCCWLYRPLLQNV